VNGRMHVCMLAYTYYDTDNRVRRYAETLVNRGDTVDVVALKRRGEPLDREKNGVRLFQIQERIRDERTRWSYLLKLIKFFIKSTFFLWRQNRIKPYDLIHVHSIPDFEVFATIWPKLKGTKIILDIHDLVPEFYQYKFKVSSNSIIFKFLRFAEKMSIRFVDHVIISNHLWYNTIISRATKPEKCTVIINYPDATLFQKKNIPKSSNKVVLLYPGTLNRHQGVELAIRAFAQIHQKIPEAMFQIYGDGPVKNELQSLIQQLGVEDQVCLNEPVTLEEMAKIIAEADIGIIPKRNDGFGRFAFSTKALEFQISGVPIIIAKTVIDQYYFDSSFVHFFEPDNENELAKAIYLLVKNNQYRNQLAEKALKMSKKYEWSHHKHIYLDLIDTLVSSKSNIYRRSHNSQNIQKIKA